jgi:TatA/E family protein of Tat protein translocase
MPFNIGAPELIIILVIALLIIGPGKLPDVGSALGKSIREFRKASSDIQESVKVDATPLPPQAASAQPAPAPTATAEGAPAQPATAEAAPAQPAPAEPPAATPIPNVLSEATAPNVLSQPAPAEETADVAK